MSLPPKGIIWSRKNPENDDGVSPFMMIRTWAFLSLLPERYRLCYRLSEQEMLKLKMKEKMLPISNFTAIKKAQTIFTTSIKNSFGLYR